MERLGVRVGEPKAGIPGAGEDTSLLGALLKSLTTGDLALTLCSQEPPVLLAVDSTGRGRWWARGQ